MERIYGIDTYMPSGTIGSYLQELRLSRGVSIRALARSAGVNASTLSRWESGATRPSNYELEAVLRALNASEVESQGAWERLNAPRALTHPPPQSSLADAPPVPLQGNLLRAMRMRKGWTLAQTACALGITAMTLSRWERSENIPSIEDRLRLGQVLGATQAELDALCKAESVWLPLPHPLPKTLHELEEVLYLFTSTPHEEGLEDLYYLSFEALLNRLVRRGQPAQALLTTVYAIHSRALTNQCRLREAQTPAYSALWWMERMTKIEPRWLDVVHVVAKGNAELRSRFTPHAGIETLTRWLPIASEISPLHEEWFLRDIAEYRSYTREHASAEALIQALLAREHSQLGWDPNRIFTRAVFLVNTKRFQEAIELLEMSPALRWDDRQVPLQNLNIAFVWIRALRGVGREEEAHEWQTRAHELIRYQHIWQARTLLTLIDKV